LTDDRQGLRAADGFEDPFDGGDIKTVSVHHQPAAGTPNKDLTVPKTGQEDWKEVTKAFKSQIYYKC
jgi:hypothetical protein